MCPNWEEAGDEQPSRGVGTEQGLSIHMKGWPRTAYHRPNGEKRAFREKGDRRRWWWPSWTVRAQWGKECPTWGLTQSQLSEFKQGEEIGPQEGILMPPVRT